MLSRIFSGFGTHIARLGRDTAGATAIFVAVGLVPLIGSVGLAVDASHSYLLKGRIAKSLDTAALAAGRVALDANAADVARRYFDANFEQSDSIVVTDFSFELDESEQFVTLTAQAEAPTFFMRIFGQKKINVSARTVVQRATVGMELALVLDNTNSMASNNKFETMRKAAYDLVDSLYKPGEDTVDNLWISVVPFIASVNVGPSHTGWIVSGDRVHTAPTSFGAPLNAWKGCVRERAYPMDTNDTPPTTTATRFASYYWSNSGAYKGSNRNYACGAPTMGLTASRNSVRAALAKMDLPPPAGGTTSNIGLAWGWRTLSPRWRGLWGGETPANLPLEYGTSQMVKVAVILTDGDNMLGVEHYSGYGPTTDLGRINYTAMLNTRLTEVCNQMKAADKNIQIFSIIFGDTPTTTIQNLFRGCATNTKMYYYAPSNTALAAAFRSIGGQLASLRIVE